MRMHAVLKTGVLIFFLSFLPEVVQAQDKDIVTTRPPTLVADRAPYELLYDHLSGVIELKDAKGNHIEQWNRRDATPPLASIPPGRPVSIVIQNANALFYTYDVNANLIRQGPLKSCKNIGSQFTSQGFLLASSAVTGASVPALDFPKITTGFLDVNTAFTKSLAAQRGPGGRDLTIAQLQQQMNRIRRPVDEYLSFANTLVQLAEAVEDSLALFASMGDVMPLDSVLERFQRSLEDQLEQPGVSDPARMPLIVNERTNRVREEVGILYAAAESIEKDKYEGSRKDLLPRETLQLKATVDTVTHNLQESYIKLQRGLLQIKRAQAQMVQVFTVRPSRGGFRRLVIKIRSKTDFPDVLHTRKGEVEIFTKPEQSLLCQLSLGVSWMDPPTGYEEKDSILIESAKDDVRVTPTLFMHVAVSDFSFIGGLFGIGLGKNEAPDLYVGGSIRLFDPVMLNGGVVWQRAPKLSDKLVVGQPIADPALLDNLDQRYRRTVFFSISVVQ